MLTSCDIKFGIPEYSSVIKTYIKAFPKSERLPFGLLKHMARRDDIDFKAFYKDGSFAALTFSVETDSIVYVLFLATNEKRRGEGIGSKVIRELGVLYHGKKIVLNMETLEDTEAVNFADRVRRRRFYRKNNFRESPIRLVDKGGSFDTLSLGGKTSLNELDEALSKLNRRSYSYYSFSLEKK